MKTYTFPSSARKTLCVGLALAALLVLPASCALAGGPAPAAASSPAPAVMRPESASLDAEYASQTGTAITIVFDNSGSMLGTKITEARRAFRWWLEKSLASSPGTTATAGASSTAWSLITFDGNGKVAVHFTSAADAPLRIADRVDKLYANTSTPIVGALNVAMQEIRTRREKVSPYQRHVVLLFTDGEENVDGGGTTAVLNKIRSMRAAGVEVVGIGFYGQGDYLAQAATRYYQADNEAQLRAGLARVDAEVNTASLGGEVSVTPEDLKAMGALPSGGSSAAVPEIAEHNTPVTGVHSDEFARNLGVLFVVLSFGFMIFILLFVRIEPHRKL